MSLFSKRAEVLFSRRAQILGLFADILDYPAPGLARKASECAALISAAQPEAAALLESFRGFAEENSLGKLQEVYSGFFDLNSICHPYVGYQLFGENYKRSAFLIGLKKAYRDEGFEATISDIPDRLSIVLRFVAHSKGGEEIDELLNRGLLPALARMTTKPESDAHQHDGQPIGNLTGVRFESLGAVGFLEPDQKAATFVILSEQLIAHIRMANRVQVKKAAVNLLKLAHRGFLGEAAEALQQGGRLRLRRADQRGAFGRLSCQSRSGIIEYVRE